MDANEILFEDSFDTQLANCDIPTSPKQMKIDPSPSEEGPSNKPKLNRSHCILVSPKQKGNRLLKAITNVPWEYEDIVPDYIMGKTTCALFLSLKYHNLKPDYIHQRLKLLGNSYECRVLLVLVDMQEPHVLLKNLTRICILANLTLILAWNDDEAGKIIETYKMFESKPPDIIMERSEQYPHQKLVSALTCIKPVNQTDAMTILSAFGNLENISKASERTLCDCIGFGKRKALKLHKVLHEPFLKIKDKSSTKKNTKPVENREFTNALHYKQIKRIEQEEVDTMEIDK